MSEFQNAIRLTKRMPLVPIYCETQGAGWFGKWHFNATTAWNKSIGGPWDTCEEAVAAALSTGLFQLRVGTETPHLDPKSMTAEGHHVR